MRVPCQTSQQEENWIDKTAPKAPFEVLARELDRQHSLSHVD
jgi:hypothetical protein